MDKLVTYVKNNMPLTDLAIAHSAYEEGAMSLKKRLADIFPEDKILISELGPALGVHGGPGVLLLALRQE